MIGSLLTVLSYGEKFLLTLITERGNGGYFICTTCLTICLFAFAIKNPMYDANGLLEGWAHIGRKYTLMIYLIHPFVLQVLERIVVQLNNSIQTVYYQIVPIIVFIISLLFSVFFYRCIKK